VKIQPQWVVTPGKQTNKQHVFISGVFYVMVTKEGLTLKIGPGFSVSDGCGF
jgi:hypothetical protein